MNASLTQAINTAIPTHVSYSNAGFKLKKNRKKEKVRKNLLLIENVQTYFNT